MTAPRDLMAKRAILGQAVAKFVALQGSVGGRSAGRNVAILYALAAMGPAPADSTQVGLAVCVTPQTARRLCERLTEWGWLEQVGDSWTGWQLAGSIVLIANRLGADL